MIRIITGIKNRKGTAAIRIGLLGIVALLLACQDEYNLYDRKNAFVQFGPEQDKIYKSSFDLADTAKSFTFVYLNSSVVQDTVYFDLYALGGPSEVDRKFAIKQVQVPGSANAEPGKQYVAFDDPSVSELYQIKAGEVHLRMPVIMLRDESLTTETYVLGMELEDNENFLIGDPNLIWRKLYFSDQLIKPSYWNIFETYFFGKYSKVKHRFMIDETGQRWDDDFFIQIYKDYSYAIFWRTTLNARLTDYNNAHPNDPLRDENGELISFP
jgi:hypothetical protein